MLPQIYTPKVFVVALALLLCAALWMAAKASAKASATTMSMKLVRAARNVSGRRIGGVRRKPSTFLTRVPLSSSQTAPRTQQSNAAHDRWEQVFLHTSELAARGDVALSGRALLYTAPCNIGANVTAHRSKGNVAYATLACCSPGVRGAAMPGDLIITISVSPSNASARGVNLEHGRVVQSIMIAEGSSGITTALRRRCGHLASPTGYTLARCPQVGATFASVSSCKLVWPRRRSCSGVLLVELRGMLNTRVG